MTSATDTLRENIQSGKYKSGERLPTERALSQELSAQRSTVRAAIAQLTDEGLLSKKWNCRPIVQGPNGHAETANQDRPKKKSRVHGPNGLTRTVNQDRSAKQPPFSGSRLVALVMWHGGTLEQDGTAQQRIFWGLNQELGLAGYHAVFMDLGAKIGTDEANAEREATHLQYALDHNFAGVVFYPYAYDHNHELVESISHRMPLIVIDRMLPGIESDYVGMQNRQALADATSHLIALGHRRIAHISKNEPINTVQERLQGYLQAMQEHFGNNAYEMVLSMPSMFNDNWPIFDIVFRLGLEERPTALVCVNDYDAAYVTTKLLSLGLEIPRDISVIGCDNLIQTLDNGVGLTSIAQPFQEMGAEAARLFLRRKQEPSAEHIKIELPAKLVLRESCAKV